MKCLSQPLILMLNMKRFSLFFKALFDFLRKIAEAFNGKGYTVKTHEELETALKETFASNVKK